NSPLTGGGVQIGVNGPRLNIVDRDAACPELPRQPLAEHLDGPFGWREGRLSVDHPPCNQGREPLWSSPPPLFRCLSAACVATKTPRTLTAKTRSKSASVVSSTFIGMTVPALFTSTSSRSNVVTVSSTASLTASASAASARIAIAFPPPRSISLTTDAAASAPLE